MTVLATAFTEMRTGKNSYSALPLAFALFLIHAAYLSCVAEDAFISFRYAENLANGLGLTWNAGEPPVEGYTNFLWVIFCYLAIELKLNVILFAQITGVIAGLLTISFTYAFSRKILNCQGIHALLPCLLLATSGPFAAWAASGMESNFFGLFVLISSYYFACYWRFRSRMSLFYSSAALLIASLTRPEGIIVLLVFAVLSWAFYRRRLFDTHRSTDVFKDLLFPLLLFLILFSIYFIWRVKYYNSLLPNTYYAKTSQTIYHYLRGVIYTGFFVLYFVLPLLPAPLFIWRKRAGFAAGEDSHDTHAQAATSQNAIASKHPKPGKGAGGSMRKSPIGTHLCLLLSACYTLAIILEGGDYMAMFRFFVPILPFTYLLFGHTICTLVQGSSLESRQRRIAAILLVLAIAATLFQSTPIERRLLPKAPLQHGNYRGVQTERWHSARLSLIGKFFEDYRSDPDETLATSAVGAISYYSHMKIHDFLGIVDTHIASRKVDRNIGGWGLPGHEKADLPYIFSKKPTYVMFSRLLTKEPGGYPEASDFGFLMTKKAGIAAYSASSWEILNRIILDNYKVTSVWLTDQENGEEGYFNFLELKSQ